MAQDEVRGFRQIGNLPSNHASLANRSASTSTQRPTNSETTGSPCLDAQSYQARLGPHLPQPMPRNVAARNYRQGEEPHRTGANGHGRKLTPSQAHSLAGLQYIWDADREEDLRSSISITRGYIS